VRSSRCRVIEIALEVVCVSCEDEVSESGCKCEDAEDGVLESCGECGVCAPVGEGEDDPCGEGHDECDGVPHGDVEPREGEDVEDEDGVG